VQESLLSRHALRHVLNQQPLQEVQGRLGHAHVRGDRVLPTRPDKTVKPAILSNMEPVTWVPFSNRTCAALILVRIWSLLLPQKGGRPKSSM
jgi:hypothetical protein